MSRTDLENELRKGGFRVHARTNLNDTLIVDYLGSQDDDPDYDSYRVDVLTSPGHDPQPMTRAVYKHLYDTVRWSPDPIEPGAPRPAGTNPNGPLHDTMSIPVRDNLHPLRMP